MIKLAAPITAKTIPTIKKIIIRWCKRAKSSAVPSSTWWYPYQLNAENNNDKAQAIKLVIPTIKNNLFIRSSDNLMLIK